MSTFTPQPIKDLLRFLEEQGGDCSVARSCEPTRSFRGYHLGRTQIQQGEGACPPPKDDYSIKTARDKAALSDARAAIDIQFGAKRLQAYSKWLVGQARANAPGTSDLREIIYSPDGVRVLRWDRERGIASDPREGEADNSHRSHTHVSFYRDSEARAKVPTFSGWFAAPDPPPPEDPTVTPEQVKLLQTTLNKLGASPPLVVDGFYGPKTEAALGAAVANYDAARALAAGRSESILAAKTALETAP